MDYRLGQSLQDIRDYIADYKPKVDPEEKVFAMDTETTGLDTRRAKLVGWSISLEKDTAIYVPVGHQIGTNVDTKPSLQIVQQELMDDGFRCEFFNAKYDLNILQGNSGWYPKKYEDVLELAYLTDPDRKRKGLKELGRTELNINMERFEDLFTPEEIKAKNLNIAKKTPQRCTNYGCADADVTLQLYHRYKSIRAEQKFAIDVDTKLIEIIRRIEHNGGAEINREYVDKMIDLLTTRAEALQEQIWRIVGYKFEIASPKQLGIALFDKMGIPSPGMTRGKNPIHVTKEEVLDRLKGAHPIVEWVIAWRKVTKAKSSYFEKLSKVAQMGIPVRFQFNIYAAPTFRFAAPGGNPLVDGGIGVNIQAVSNGEARDQLAVDLTAMAGDDPYLEDMDELLVAVEEDTHVGEGADPRSLPWVTYHEEDPDHWFCFRDTCAGCPASCASQGIDTTRRLQKGLMTVPSVRQAFRAPEGFTILSFDYDRQELVIGANMSQEPKWLRALKDGVDLHVISAAGAFGMSPDQLFEMKTSNKHEFTRRRGIGKTLNFAVFYGATGYTLANKANIPVAQGERIYEEFKKAHPTLFNWINKCHVFSRKSGYTTTYFGRKRWLKQYYDLGDRKWAAFADRSAVNTAIQGTAAEVTRIAMLKCDARLKKEGIPQKDARWFIQLHDDLSFLVRNEIAPDVARMMKESMEFQVKSWDIQLSVGCKEGRVWGSQREINDLAQLEDLRRNAA